MRLLEHRLIAQSLKLSGLLRLMEALPHQNGLLVVNYHRVGNLADNPYDDATFSADAAGFKQHMQYLRALFEMPAMPELLNAIEQGRLTRPTALVTFDDGYRDNYSIAYPILKALGIPACFFVVTDYLDQPILPWWDRVAYIVKRSRQRLLQLDYPAPLRFELDEQRPRREIIRRILRALKDARPLDLDRFFHQLEARAGVTANPNTLGRELFMSWEQAIEMQQGGMCIGSHSVSHPILASLDLEGQKYELETSRLRLAQMLGTPPEVLAYPVGGVHSFTDTTKALAKAAGYRAAFRFYGGLNHSGHFDRYALSRINVEHHESFAQFRARVGITLLEKATNIPRPEDGLRAGSEGQEACGMAQAGAPHKLQNSKH